MILKWLTVEKKENSEVLADVWHYIDKVDEVTVRWSDATDGTVVGLRIHDTADIIDVAVTSEAYLLSDDGKTVERIVVTNPKVIVHRTNQPIPKDADDSKTKTNNEPKIKAK